MCIFTPNQCLCNKFPKIVHISPNLENLVLVYYQIRTTVHAYMSVWRSKLVSFTLLIHNVKKCNPARGNDMSNAHLSTLSIINWQEHACTVTQMIHLIYCSTCILLF